MIFKRIYIYFFRIKSFRKYKNTSALAGVAQWIECWPANQNVAGSIPNLGHMPGLQTRSPVRDAQEATTH